MMRALLQTHLAQPPRCFCLRLLTGNVPQQQRHGHILQSRKFRQQVMELPSACPIKAREWTRMFTSISGSIYAENCRTIVAHMCCDCGHEQACLLIAPTRADDCAPAQAENTIHKSGGSCGQANRELMRGCPVERILSWRERRNHSRRAEI